MWTNTIIITGANSSLAIPTIEYLLQHSPNSTLVLTVRDASERDINTKTLRSIIAKQANTRVSIRELDLANLAAVHDFARGIAAEIITGTLPRLSAIVGAAFYWNLVDTDFKLTEDGYEKTIQVNYLSHFALVLRLISSFQSQGGRIILFTSDGHEPGKNALEKIPPAIPSDPAQLELLVKPDADTSNDALGHGMHRYANSKLALVLFTHTLNRRLEQNAELKNITAIVMNPGNLADSRALLTNTPYKLVFLRNFVLKPLLPVLRMSDPTARTSAAAAIDVARLAINEAHPGERGYFTLGQPDQGSKDSRNEVAQEALWSKSVLWVGVTTEDSPLVKVSPN